MKKTAFIMMGVTVFAGFWYFGGDVNIIFLKERLSLVKKEEIAVVSQVIDGDTVDLADGRRVRYIGIDTPEMGHEGKPDECFAREAKEKNQELVEGKEVRLVRDVSEKDKYRRWLYLVFMGDISVEESLVRGGYAKEMTIKPDVHYALDIRKWEREARAKNLGVWGCK